MAPELAASLADLLQSVADEVEEWADDVTKGEGTGHLTGVSKVSDEYRDVLQAARSPGVDRETAAVADAIAVDGMRISVDLRTEPDPPPPAPSDWRSLLAPSGLRPAGGRLGSVDGREQRRQGRFPGPHRVGQARSSRPSTTRWSPPPMPSAVTGIPAAWAFPIASRWWPAAR